jgi:hypothetical protein
VLFNRRHHPVDQSLPPSLQSDAAVRAIPVAVAVPMLLPLPLTPSLVLPPLPLLSRTAPLSIATVVGD